MMSSIKKISCAVTSRTLKEPFITSLRTVSTFNVLEFHIETDGGYVAVGETVETPAITGHTQEMIMAAFHGPLKDAIEGISFASPLELVDRIAQTSTVSSAKAAADMALYYLESAIQGASLDELLESSTSSVRSDVTIPVTPPQQIENLVLSRSQEGFRAFKVKLSMEPVQSSIDKLKLIQQVTNGESAIRVDPNQAWSVPHTLEFVSALDDSGIDIDYLEQPTPAEDRAALAEIRRNSSVPIMADESCFDMQDLLHLIDLDAVDIVNLKLLKSGGISQTFRMASVAHGAGIGVRIGSMMEGDAGVLAAACIASAIAPEETHDLDASWWAENSRIGYKAGEVLLR